MFAYLLYKFVAFLVQRMSLPTARRCAAVVGRFTCLFQRRNRRHLLVNLRTAFGDELSERELRRLRLRVYENFSKTVTEFLWMPKISRENITEIMTEESLEQYRVLTEAAGETGVISTTAHVGNWELGAAGAALLGYDMTALVDFHPSPLVTAFFDQRREDKGVEVVPVTAFHRCFRALKRGRVTAIVGDRPVTGEGIRAKFFGKDTLVPIGHTLLARRFGATIIPTFLVMGEDGRYELLLEDPIVPNVTDDEEADVRECTERCLRVFERYVSKYRDQWFVFRPVWDRPVRARRWRTKVKQ